MHKGFTVFAALIAAALVATPVVVGAGKALAISERTKDVASTVVVTPIEVAQAAAVTEPCARKVRVVYGGYGAAPSACASLR